MKLQYSCVDTVEFLYPDVIEYQSGVEHIELVTPRSSYACAQVILWNGIGSISVTCEGWNPEIYEMIAVPVECNVDITEKNRTCFTPVREAPFYVYDCLKPYTGEITFHDGVCAIYFSWWIPEDAPIGMVQGTVKIGDIFIPVNIKISSAVVPKESLAMIFGYEEGLVCQYHNVDKDSKEFNALNDAYLNLLRRMRQNGILCNDTRSDSSFPFMRTGKNKYDFDFSVLEKEMEDSISRGFTLLCYGLGYRESWDTSTITLKSVRLPAMSYEGYCYLAQFLPALSAFLERKGWMDSFMLSVLDEVNQVSSTEYRALCGLVRKFAPKIKMIDAVCFADIHGGLDIYIPSSEGYEKHKEFYDMYRDMGDTVWYYDCCGPRGNNYINRFMDDPLLSTRYHGWGNYAYDLAGYLHWAVNVYQPGQDPFTQSCPEHKNADSVRFLPPGDTHIVYPGDSGPWMSVRLENYRAGAEEYEMLKAVATVDKTLADQICASVFHSFNNVEYDTSVFKNTRQKLIKAMEQLCSDNA